MSCPLLGRVGGTGGQGGGKALEKVSACAGEGAGWDLYRMEAYSK